LLEPDRIKAVHNIQKYQDEIKAWRDSKVKLRELDVGDLVLLWSPYTESLDKLKAKWVGSYVVVAQRIYFSRPILFSS
jgi:hypothetical protein